MTVGTLTAWSWVAFAGIAALLGLAGYGTIWLHRHELARQKARRQAYEAVPLELRFQAEPLPFRIAGLTAVIAAAAAGGIVTGQWWGSLVVGSVALAPFYAVTLRHRKLHERQVIAVVRRRAGDMSPEDLRRLLDGLDISHGRFEMRALRRLADGDDTPVRHSRPFKR